MKNYIMAGFLTSAMLIANSCAVNPVTGKKQVVFTSEAQEITMGKEADPQVIAEYGLYDDKALQSFITEEGKKIAAISHRPNLDYQYKIVDSEVINAFAIPGGYVYFTRGIMAHFNNEAEFAGVLGHETGHITARHSVIQQRNQILGQVGLMAGMVLSPTVAQFGEQASQGLSLMFLKFDRDAERQADELGVEYSSKIGFDAQQMAQFFTTLERQSAASGAEELPDFLSTHPSPASRQATVSKLAAEWKQKLNLTNPVVNRNTYLKRIDGIIYGEDPKQGFVENFVFYHPVLKMQFNIPANWKYQNSPQAVQMAPTNGKAMMMMTLAPGKTLQEAASATLQKYSLQSLESREVTVNGLRALSVIADQIQQQQGQQQQQQQASIRTLSYFIQYGDLIYHLIGVSNVNEFNSYLTTFSNSMQSFKQLRDAEKLNRKPDRVRIKTISQSITLEQALRNYKITDKKKLDEYAILNGMKLSDKLAAGTMIKVVER